MTWLVTGGAGYIGSHVVAALQEARESVVVLDDFSSGDRRRISGVPVVEADIRDAELVTSTLRRHSVSGVVHLAAKKRVEESVSHPLIYYHENVEGLRALLHAVTTAGVPSFVFSSSAAVYGAPDVEVVTEETPCVPVNPYGRTKHIGEQMLADVAAATGLRTVALRYFNVAGAARPDLADRGVANLVPLVFQQLDARKPPLIFGDDYPTPDGTCVRDFIHVADVASAHVAAARALAAGEIEALTANIGRGEGISVRQVIEEILQTTGLSVEHWARPEVRDRRAGDPPRVVGATDRARKLLRWSARYDLHDMVTSAWAGWKYRRR